MATETYRWFRPDTKLRSGSTILVGSDTAECDAFSLMTRAVCNALGLPSGGTRHLFDRGNASDGFTYARVPELMWAAVSPYLTTAELATVVTTAPTGWGVATALAFLQPNPRKKSIILNGDSISQGLGTTSGDTRDVFLTQAINGISGETLIYGAPNYREGESKSFYVGNLGLGSSSWANTIGQPDGNDANQAAQYPRRQDLSYEQRVSTLALNSVADRAIFIYWLGTNDLAYDTSLSGADVWQRVVTRITAFRSKFPSVKLAVGTTIKRSELTPLNSRINDYNNLMRANYASAGITALMDFEANVPQVNISTGNTGNTSVYTDGVHLTTAGQGLLAPVARSVIQSLLP